MRHGGKPCKFLTVRISATPDSSKVGAASMVATLFLCLCAAILRVNTAFSIFTQSDNLARHRVNGLFQKSYLLQMASDATDASSILDLKKRLCLYNTLTKEKQQFVALDKDQKKVSFYSCGPTVYDYAHIGNFRAFLTYDVLKRWLEYAGYTVDHVCNLTDVDDKIIVKMASENKSLKEVTELYTNAFFEDLDVLNIQRAGIYPKATEHITEIKDMISQLVDTGFAYVEKGSVYFRVKSFEAYGKLARLKMQEMQDGMGGSGPNDRRGSDDKESSRDFALWKSFNPMDKEVVWDSPFGRGRPGWHIECSAMCNKHLGDTIDIHAGGVDLVFPHHENEIAQSEAFSGKQFCNYWIHNGFVNINDEKMSKSLKNFKTLRDIAQSPFDARAFRFMVVTSQYRNPLNFNPETLKSASNSLKRIDKLLANLALASSSTASTTSDMPSGDTTTSSADVEQLIKSTIASFEEAMCDDMNTPRAAAALFTLVGMGEKLLKSDRKDPGNIASILRSILQIDVVFGVVYNVPQAYFAPQVSGGSSQSSSEALPADMIPQNILELVEKRTALKSQKLFTEADAIRAELSNLGYIIKDRKSEVDVFKI